MSQFCEGLFFYDNSIKELSQIILELKPYILKNQPVLSTTPIQNNNNTKVESPVIELPKYKSEQLEDIREVLKPSQKDTLFWCLYIIAYGYSDYQYIKRNHCVKLLEEQTKAIDYLKTDKMLLKNTNMKFTNVAIQEVYSDLLSISKKTNYRVAIAMCVFYKINIYIVNNENKTYLKFLSNSDNPSYILYRDGYDNYSVDISSLSTQKVIELEEKMICLESYIKPLKAISNYKISELTEFAKKLNVLEDNKKYKKADIYELISDKIRW